MSFEARMELTVEWDLCGIAGEKVDTSAAERQPSQVCATRGLPSLPRYVPCATAAGFLAAWYDRQDDRYVALCPECHRLIAYDALHTLYLEMVWGECCQGCRARLAFRLDPDLVGRALTCWHTTGTYPQSPSWLEGISRDACYRWATEIQAGLDAATAPEVQRKGSR